MPLTLPLDVVSTLEEGRQAYVAVPSKRGPHVTPELYVWSGGRLWFAAATSTVKVSVLRRDPRVGVVVGAPGRSVLLAGEVDVVDPRDPATVVRQVRDLPGTAAAVARFTTRNAADLLAFGTDALTGRLGKRLPPLRVLFGLRPTAAAHVVNDALVGAWGDWQGAPTDDDHVVPAGGERAVAGLPGPIAMPARWFGDQQLLHVAPPLLALVDVASSFDLGVVVDDYTAPGPAAKRGTLVRARGRLVVDDPGYVEVEPERVVSWDGVSSSTRTA